MYAVMLIPNCGQFLYVKLRRSHAFFNPAHLNLRQLQWDLNIQIPGYKHNGAGHSELSNNHGSSRAPGIAEVYAGGWGGYGDSIGEEEDSSPPDDVMADAFHGSNHNNSLPDAWFTT